MIWKRLKRLWALSTYEPTLYTKDGELELEIKPTLFKTKKKRKQRLATIVQDEPLEVFEEQNDTPNK